LEGRPFAGMLAADPAILTVGHERFRLKPDDLSGS